VGHRRDAADEIKKRERDGEIGAERGTSRVEAVQRTTGPVGRGGRPRRQAKEQEIMEV
jgi:ribosome recycling factor